MNNLSGRPTRPKELMDAPVIVVVEKWVGLSQSKQIVELIKDKQNE